MNTKNFVTSFLRNFWILVLLGVVVSCNKTFDEPPLGADPNVTANLTIKDLKAMYNAIGVFEKINDDKIISGVVIADDRSGNFYKQIIIQDETGGIPVLLDGNNVYTSYPVGRKVFIKVKGLMLGDYGGNIQLGLDSVRSDDGRFLNLGRIPQTLFDQYILKGSFGNTVAPRIVKPSDFTKNSNDPLYSILVQINNAEFGQNDLGKTYADADNKQTVSAVNYNIRPCDDTKSIVLRNSSYARFAAIKLPEGNGALVGVPGIFNGTIQMFIRDSSDVKFTGARCSAQPVTVKTIADLLKYAAPGSDSTIPYATAIEGTIISSTSNEAAGNYRVQDATGGIALYFAKGSNPVPGALGDKIRATVSDLNLSLFNGTLQVSGVSSSSTIGTGTVTPRMVTIEDIKNNARAWESTVVGIKGLTFTEGSSTSNGKNYIVKDATGEITTFVRTTSGIAVPPAADTVIGYVSIYQPAGEAMVPQLVLRTSADIKGGNTGGIFSAVYDFSGVTNSSGTTDPTAVPSVEGLVFSSFTAVGVGSNSSAGGRFSFNSWALGASANSDVFTGSLDPAKYYEVTIAPAAGKKLNLTKLSFTVQRSGTGVRQLAVRSGLDAYAANLPATIDPPHNDLSVVGSNVFQVSYSASTSSGINGCTISFGNEFQNSTQPVTLRFYGFNAVASGGTFSIDNVKFDGKVQ